MFPTSPFPRAAWFFCLVLLLAGCGDGVGPSEPDPIRNFVRLESDPGDYILGGQTLEYTQADAILRVFVSPNVVHVRVEGDQAWYGEFGVPTTLPLQNGTYTGATAYSYNTDVRTSPGLTWWAAGQACNTLTGSFTIDSLDYTAGVLSSIDVRFEQQCEGSEGALRGTIRWRADDPTIPAGPIYPVPGNLWRPDPSFVPASGNYVLLASDPGDFIGQGEFQVYTPANSQIGVSSSGTYISVGVGGYLGEFVGMVGTIPLRRGYYGNLLRYRVHNPARGGLSWYGNGRGCNRLTGWFAIDRIVYTGATMTALEMRFEQHCEEGVPALRGAIRWSQ